MIARIYPQALRHAAPVANNNNLESKAAWSVGTPRRRPPIDSTLPMFTRAWYFYLYIKETRKGTSVVERREKKRGDTRQVVESRPGANHRKVGRDHATRLTSHRNAIYRYYIAHGIYSERRTNCEKTEQPQPVHAITACDATQTYELVSGNDCFRLERGIIPFATCILMRILILWRL